VKGVESDERVFATLGDVLEALCRVTIAFDSPTHRNKLEISCVNA